MYVLAGLWIVVAALLLACLVLAVVDALRGGGRRPQGRVAGDWRPDIGGGSE